MFFRRNNNKEDSQRARLDASELYDSSKYEVNTNPEDIESKNDERSIEIYVSGGGKLSSFCAPYTDENFKKLKEAISNPEIHKWVELEDFDNEIELIRTDSIVVIYTEKGD